MKLGLSVLCASMSISFCLWGQEPPHELKGFYNDLNTTGIILKPKYYNYCNCDCNCDYNCNGSNSNNNYCYITTLYWN